MEESPSASILVPDSSKKNAKISKKFQRSKLYSSDLFHVVVVISGQCFFTLFLLILCLLAPALFPEYTLWTDDTISTLASTMSDPLSGNVKPMTAAFPPVGATLPTGSVDWDWPFFLHRFLILTLVLSTLKLIQKGFMTSMMSQFYRKAYGDHRVEKQYFSLKVIQRMILFMNESKKLDSVPTKTGPSQGITEPLSPKSFWMNMGYYQYRYGTPLFKATSGMMQNNFRELDEILRNESTAKHLAFLLFRHYEKLFGIPTSDTQLKEGEQSLGIIDGEKAFTAILDCHSDVEILLMLISRISHRTKGYLTATDFSNFLVFLCQERNSLSQSLTDHRRAVHQVEKLASLLTLLITALLIPLLYGVSMLRTMTSILGLLAGFSFMFAPSAAALFNAILFLFLTHPFDIGDRVLIGRRVYFVHEIRLFCTVMKQWDGLITYYPNTALQLSDFVANIYRSKPMQEYVPFVVRSQNLVQEQLVKLDQGLTAFFKKHKEHFFEETSSSTTRSNPSGCSLTGSTHMTGNFRYLRALEWTDSYHLKLMVLVKYKDNFHDGPMKWDRHFLLITELHRLLHALKFSFTPLPLKVSLQDDQKVLSFLKSMKV